MHRLRKGFGTRLNSIKAWLFFIECPLHFFYYVVVKSAYLYLSINNYFYQGELALGKRSLENITSNAYAYYILFITSETLKAFYLLYLSGG